MKKYLALFLAIVIAPATAQSVIQAQMANVTPAVSRDQVGVSSCGLNFVVGAMTGDDKAVVYDFSANIYNTGHGVIKAGSHSMVFFAKTGWDMEGKKARAPGPKLVWLAKRDDSAAIRPEKYIKAESAGFVMGGASLESTVELLFATADGEPMQISMEYASDRIHRVIGFQANMTQDDRQAFGACVSGLMKRMEAELMK